MLKLMLSAALTLLVATLHFGFFVLESFFWDKPMGRKVFGTTAAQAEHGKVLAFNQGFYNAILAAGLLWSLIRGNVQDRVFFLGAVVVAGLVGGFSASRSILVVQALPAALAIATTLFLH